MARSLIITVLLAAIAVLLLLGKIAFFRSEKVDNPSLGSITYSHRWGRPYSIEADSNLDGRVDFRALVLGDDDFSAHTEPKEFWEDRDFDGAFEYHVVMKESEVARLEIDRDADGTYETVLVGNEAAQEYSRIAERYSTALPK